MKNLFNILSFLCVSLGSFSQEIKNAVIYKSFLNAGSTGAISYAFNNPSEYRDIFDTTKVNVDLKSELNNLLKSSIKRKQRQRKIGGILYAGEYFIDNSKHFFIITDSMLIDFTDRKNYIFSKESSHFFEMIKKKVDNMISVDKCQ